MTLGPRRVQQRASGAVVLKAAALWEARVQAPGAGDVGVGVGGIGTQRAIDAHTSTRLSREMCRAAARHSHRQL